MLVFSFQELPRRLLLTLRRCTPGRWGALRVSSVGLAISSALCVPQVGISTSLRVNGVRSSQWSRRNRGTFRMCWFPNQSSPGPYPSARQRQSCRSPLAGTPPFRDTDEPPPEDESRSFQNGARSSGLLGSRSVRTCKDSTASAVHMGYVIRLTEQLPPAVLDGVFS